ncbi:hypothetical protein C8C98_0937 [Acidovorax sp. 106]|nr:hypothetical protein C8C98_0937 [Acidovorax sp. 106]
MATAESTLDAAAAPETPEAPFRCCTQRTNHGKHAMPAMNRTTTDKVWVIPGLSTTHAPQTL